MPKRKFEKDRPNRQATNVTDRAISNSARTAMYSKGMPSRFNRFFETEPVRDTVILRRGVQAYSIHSHTKEGGKLHTPQTMSKITASCKFHGHNLTNISVRRSKGTRSL